LSIRERVRKVDRVPGGLVVDTVSRVQAILAAPDAQRRRAQVVRVMVHRDIGADPCRVTLAPGDRLVVENRTCRTLHVAPLDFFGNAFERHVLEHGESTPPLAVHGLWFQVEVHANGRDFYPLDVYLAPNRAQR
jgi:hypothetical protein